MKRNDIEKCCLYLPPWFYKFFLILIFLIVIGILIWSLLLDKNNSNNNINPPKPQPKAEALFAKSNIPGYSYSTVTDSQNNVFITGYYFSSNPIDLNGDGSVILPSSNFSIFTIKYDSSGKALMAKTFETDNGGYSYTIILDKNENFYITGVYNSSVDIDLNGDSSIVLPLTNGNVYTFLIKYNQNGIATLGKTINGKSNQYSNLILDSSSNIFITGNYVSDTIIDLNGDSSVTLPISQFSGSCFLIKYNQAGIAIFAKTFPTPGPVNSGTGLGIAIDSSDNIYVTGNYISSSIIDLNGDSSVTLPIISTNDYFLIKYNQSGTAIFAKVFEADIRSTGQYIKIDSQDNIFVTGYYQSNTNIYLTPDAKIFLPSNIYPSIFLIKYNINGDVIASTNIQGNVPIISTGQCISTDNLNNIYLSGAYASDIDIYITNSLYLQAAPPGLNNSTSIFFISYDSNLNPIYTKSIIGALESSGNGISIDNQKNLYLTGGYASDINISLNQEGNIILPITLGGITYAYLIKYENLV